jgi:hypothetical protein
MPRTFYPQKSKDIEASAPHPEGTSYKVSVGLEDWGDGKFKSVAKIQMSYDGIVSGRKCPSYPVGSDDQEKVHNCVNELTAEYNKEGGMNV